MSASLLLRSFSAALVIRSSVWPSLKPFSAFSCSCLTPLPLGMAGTSAERRAQRAAEWRQASFTREKHVRSISVIPRGHY